ncbi:MAG: hypothetical protein B7Y43_07210 [Sphingomonas sp. 28-62-20]|nr:MAG: hypothetical protein B7Y43_07210 [Sphingomonas sp. 28-62-20]
MKALRTERTRVEGAIQNWYGFIDRGVFSASAVPISNKRSCWSNASYRSPTDGLPPKPLNGWAK